MFDPNKWNEAKPHRPGIDRSPGERPAIEKMTDFELEAALARVEIVARMMDSMFEIPGTRIRIGVDALIGMIPILGDLISQAISSYIIWEAKQLGVSKFTLARMIGNSAIDTIVGMIPFAGDAFDVAFRANMKNLALLKAHIEKHGRTVRREGQDGVIDVTARRID